MIYLIKLSDLEPHLDHFINLIGKKRKEQINKDKLLQTKLSHLASGLLYRFCLGDNYEELLYFNEHGKPCSKDKNFNISHSGDYAVLYISENECGIDIEKMNSNKVARTPKIFTENELQWIGENTENFFTLWTRKESISKAIGMGFSYPFKEINSLQKKCICNAKEYFTETFCYDNHIISVTEENKLPETDMQILSIEELMK